MLKEKIGENLPPLEEKEKLPEKKLEDLPEADAVVVFGEWMKRNVEDKAVPTAESKIRAMGALELLRLGKAKKIIVGGGIRKISPRGRA